MRFVALEYAVNGDLESYIDRKKANNEMFDSFKAVRFVMDISEAIAYVHSKKLVHGKIDSTNILVSSDGKCKLNVSSMAEISATNSPFSSNPKNVRFLAPDERRRPCAHMTCMYKPKCYPA